MDPELIRRSGHGGDARGAPPGATASGSAHAMICLLCGRLLGHILHGRFIAQPGSLGPERRGRALRCRHCAGSVVLEADPEFSPVPTPAEILVPLKGTSRPGRPRLRPVR